MKNLFAAALKVDYFIPNGRIRRKHILDTKPALKREEGMASVQLDLNLFSIYFQLISGFPSLQSDFMKYRTYYSVQKILQNRAFSNYFLLKFATNTDIC